MTGNSYNSSNMKKGQVLLIVVMLLATALTLALTASYQSVTETQLTKLEEENQKALAAAEAGIEKALQSKQEGSFTSLGLSNLSGIDTFQSSVEISDQGSTTFITPLLQKDEQYTFYLVDYPNFTTYWSGQINTYFKTESACPSLELTQIKNDNSLVRNIVDPCNQITNNNLRLGTTSGPYSFGGFNFDYKLLNNISISNTKLLIVRVLFAPTRIGFQGSTNFPLQGSTIISTAKTQAGVEKKVQLFQSYPQIPSEFFVTSF
jgi:type II secretory pathway pseudopilin PulG